MEPPYPGPSLMLPAIDLSRAPDINHHITYKKREAVWKQLVSKTHAEWCLCGSYKNHFVSPTEPLQCGGDLESIEGITGVSEGDVSEDGRKDAAVGTSDTEER
nr:ORF2 [Torque teno felis virus]